MNRSLLPKIVAASALALAAGTLSAADALTLTVRADKAGTPVSADLFGIFFEDINYAADGGLYAELVQNRSFEYDALEQTDWNKLSFWTLEERGGGRGRLAVDAGLPIHGNNPNYAVVQVFEPGEGVGISNPGFNGIPVEQGKRYRFTAFVKQIYAGAQWGPDANKGERSRFTVLLEGQDGSVLGKTVLGTAPNEWTKREGMIEATATDPNARLVILVNEVGGYAFDVVSLFPEDTFKGRPNGLRADLAQALADMRPRFVRFPGGCLVHGNGLSNMYRWQDTVGPVEQRREQPNIWRYHQTVGLGYYEYFQFCEDIGAKPMPILPAAVSCQNSGFSPPDGQRGIPMEDMPAYIQEVLDLIEWANGPADSYWGSIRAAAGHPEPFNLEYVGIGNEDRITPGFEERFKMIYDAVKAKHPEITVIGTVGPMPDGEDFEKGWEIARELDVPIVDEHYYRPPEWFLENLHRYDAYDRSEPTKVYLGEYAAHDKSRANTLRSAIAEAAYMTALERNGDVVLMASYAPLFGKLGNTQWNPNLIYFTNTEVFPTNNYEVQKLFGNNTGHKALPAELSADASSLAYSAVKDADTGDLIVKIVNSGDAAQPVDVELDGLALDPGTQVTRTVFGGDPDAPGAQVPAEGFRPGRDAPMAVSPEVQTLPLRDALSVAAPAQSLTVIRIPASL